MINSLSDPDHQDVHMIGLVEDHESVISGISLLLANEPDLHLAAHAPTVDGLLEQAMGLSLAILDLRLEDGSSPTSNVGQLKAKGIPVLVFTGGEDPYLVRLAASAGVLGVLRKSQSNTTVVSAIRMAVRGEGIITTEWAAAIDSDPGLNAVGLSPRQLQVLELYASGETTSRVAHLMGLQENTVIDYVRRIRLRYAEAGRPAPTRTELYKRALEDGYLPLPRRPFRRS